MSSVQKILKQLREEPTNVRFADLRKAKPYQVRQVLQAIDKLKGKTHGP